MLNSLSDSSIQFIFNDYDFPPLIPVIFLLWLLLVSLSLIINQLVSLLIFKILFRPSSPCCVLFCTKNMVATLGAFCLLECLMWHSNWLKVLRSLAVRNPAVRLRVPENKTSATAESFSQQHKALQKLAPRNVERYDRFLSLFAGSSDYEWFEQNHAEVSPSECAPLSTTSFSVCLQAAVSGTKPCRSQPLRMWNVTTSLSAPWLPSLRYCHTYRRLRSRTPRRVTLLWGWVSLSL